MTAHIADSISRVDTLLRGLAVTSRGSRPPASGIRLDIARGSTHRLVSVGDTSATLAITETVRALPAFTIELVVHATVSFAEPIPEAIVRDPHNLAVLAAACRPYCLDLIPLLTARMGFPPLMLGPE